MATAQGGARAQLAPERVSVEEVYRRVVSQRRPYCGLCLRSADEARLAAPAHLARLVATLGLKVFQPIEKRLPHACAWCERWARHALRCHAALRCAARVAALFDEMAQQAGRAARVRSCQSNVIEQLDATLSALRGAARLVHTDVLVVDSGHHAQSGVTTFSSAAAAPAWSPHIETVVLDDDDDPPSGALPPPLAPLAPAAPALQLTPLVSLYNGGKLLYVPAPAEPQQQQQHNALVLPLHNNNNNEQEDVIVFIDNDCNNGDEINNILEMMMREKADADSGSKRARRESAGQGSVVVGQLANQGCGVVNRGSQVVNQGNSVVNKGSNVVNKGSNVVNKGSNVVNKGSNVVNKGGTVVNMGSTVVNKGKSVTKGRQVVNRGVNKGRQVVNQGSSGVSQGSRVVNSGQRTVNPSESPTLRIESCQGSKQQGVNPRSETQGANAGGQGPGAGAGVSAGTGHTYMVDIDDIANLIKEQSEKEAAQQQCEARPAARAVTAARIDWEDKIPMDVISFMDATDPNSAELMGPPRAPGAPHPPAVIDLR